MLARHEGLCYYSLGARGSVAAGRRLKQVCEWDVPNGPRRIGDCMFLDRIVGPLSDLDGRTWDASHILSLAQQRAERYAALGFKHSDRVFLHHGNTLEFFVDLLAVWELGGCAIPIDGRLTAFEVETLAGAAKPRFSVWKDEPESGLSASLAALGVTVLTGWDEKIVSRTSQSNQRNA